MRNLKRALSLLLAAAMLIGMMVVGASAASSLDDFPDKDEIVNQDAVSLLTILGVIEGTDSGTFNPTGNVTRAEMAKMIATILNQGADVDGLYTGMNTGLTDVSGHWAESYINYCYSLGIIAGRGDGTFDPGADVTGTEAAKMLLVAAGYDASIEGLEGADWAIRTAALASTLGIFDNLTAPTGDPLNRDNAALLVYNALDIEMIQRYDNGYAIAYGDNRTILSTKYGVYRIQGVVVGNEWARLENTDSDAALAEGKTRLDDVWLIDSDTVNTIENTDDGIHIEGIVPFNVSTPVEYLGQTVTMYVRNTTVLANAEVLGVYLKDGVNNVLTTVATEDTMKDYLKGTGLDVGDTTEYYVNYGKVPSQSAAASAMDFGKAEDHMRNVDAKLNGYGIEMTVIDNNDDGVVDYVLWLQETLSQVIAKNDSRETTTLNAFNDNSAIDNDDIVTEADTAEGDLVLVTSYGGRYYVSEPQTVTGQMESYQASKSKEQTITVDGTAYHPSYALYEADTADNTYEFDISLCDTEGAYTEGVQFDTTYTFILDSNGNVIAFQPSEEGLYNYALILDSGYEPGAFASDASGKVKVLLPDGTEGTYTLNFSASAKNIGNQLADLSGSDTITYSTNQGIQELKAFLGTSDSDNSTTAPWLAPVNGTGTGVFVDQEYVTNTTSDLEDNYPDGMARGYVIGYSLNDNDVLTITEIVGTTKTVFVPNSAGINTPNTDPSRVGLYTTAADVVYDLTGNDTTSGANYTAGAGRVTYNNDSARVTVDRNTVAFYCTFKEDASGNQLNEIDTYGVSVGYDEMSTVEHKNFVAGFVNSRRDADLAGTVLFEAEGAKVEKDYVFVLSENTVNGSRAILDVVYMDGTVGEMTIDRDNYDEYFDRDSGFGTAYAYTTNASGVSELTGALTSAGDLELPVIHGYAWQVNNGTIAVYSDKAGTQRINLFNNTAAADRDDFIWGDYTAYDNNNGLGGNTFSYNTQIWNVEDVDGDFTSAPAGNFSRNVGREVVLVLNADGDRVRAAYITDVLDGMYTGAFNVNVPDNTAEVGDTGVILTPSVSPTSTYDSYAWFQTDATGATRTPIDTTKFSVNAATGELSALTGALTAEGDLYFFVEVTRSEPGKVSETVSSRGDRAPYTPAKLTVNAKQQSGDAFSTTSEINVMLQSGDVVLENPNFTGESGVTLTVPAGRTLTIKGNYTNDAAGDRIQGNLIVEGTYTVNNNNIIGNIEAENIVFGASATAPVISGDLTLTDPSSTVTVPSSGSLTVNGSLTTANVDASNDTIVVGADGTLKVTNPAGLLVGASSGIQVSAGATVELGSTKYMGNTSEYLFTLTAGSLTRIGTTPTWNLTGAVMTVNQDASLTNDQFTLDASSKITVAENTSLTVDNVTINDGSKIVGVDNTSTIVVTSLTVTTNYASFTNSAGTPEASSTITAGTYTWDATTNTWKATV